MDNRASDRQVVGRVDERGDEILTPGGVLVEELQRRFGGRRDGLCALARPQRIREEISQAGVSIPSRERPTCRRIGMDCGPAEAS